HHLGLHDLCTRCLSRPMVGQRGVCYHPILVHSSVVITSATMWWGAAFISTRWESLPMAASSFRSMCTGVRALEASFSWRVALAVDPCVLRGQPSAFWPFSGLAQATLLHCGAPQMPACNFARSSIRYARGSQRGKATFCLCLAHAVCRVPHRGKTLTPLIRVSSLC